MLDLPSELCIWRVPSSFAISVSLGYERSKDNSSSSSSVVGRVSNFFSLKLKKPGEPRSEIGLDSSGLQSRSMRVRGLSLDS